MSISDIITLVALILAIIAIINEKNRKHLLLKMQVIDYVIFSLAFILINYFVYYKNFYSHKLFFKVFYFNDFGFKNPNHYAYLITIIALIYLVYKIWFSFYPRTNLPKVLKFYRTQIEQHEISFLLDLIERYHVNDILKIISKSEEYLPNENWMFDRFESITMKEKITDYCISSIQYLFPSSSYNREFYATFVLNDVIADPSFTILSANQRPYLFAFIFKSFKKNKRHSFPNDMFKSYLGQWVSNKNFWLQKELRQSQDFDSGQPDYFFEQNRILGSIMGQLDVADVNQVWQPFGSICAEELKEERLKGYASKMFLEFREDQHLWEFKTYFAIEFFFVLIIEAITKKYKESHFFLHNYWYIISEIMETFKKYPPKFPDQQTVYQELINKIVSKAYHWLYLCNKFEHPGIFHDVLDCIGNIIHNISECESISEAIKVKIVNKLLVAYCNSDIKSQTNAIQIKIAEKLISPSILSKETDTYYHIINVAWEEFDKIPYRVEGQDLPNLQNLKEQVIIPLGLNVDAY